MFNSATLLILSLMLTGTPVSVTTLDGNSVEGELVSVGDQSITLTIDGEEKQIPNDSLMLVDFKQESTFELESPALMLTLVDGSLMAVDSVQLEGTKLVAASSVLGELTLPVQSVKTVQLAATDEQVTASWEDIKTRNVRDDLLVFRKENVLDYVGGSISKVGEESVTILVRNREMAAPRERVFGIVFANRTAPTGAVFAELTTFGGSRIKLKTVSLKEDVMQCELFAGLSAAVPLKNVKSLDFGGGRLKFLADLPFDSSASKQPNAEFPINWFVVPNFPAGSGGRLPLTIGKQSYDHGLWLHSGANVRFKINREFRELKAVAGFELTHPQRMTQFNPKVKLVIIGDGKELYAKEFDWQESPAELLVDLTDIRELVIRVDSLGEAQGILEHFALGDATVIK